MKSENKLMSRREAARLKVIKKIIAGQLTQSKAAQKIGLSTRQIRRICQRVREEGDKGIIHRLKWMPSNRRPKVDAVERVVEGKYLHITHADWEHIEKRRQALENLKYVYDTLYRHNMPLSSYVLRRVVTSLSNAQNWPPSDAGQAGKVVDALLNEKDWYSLKNAKFAVYVPSGRFFYTKEDLYNALVKLGLWPLDRVSK